MKVIFAVLALVAVVNAGIVAPIAYHAPTVISRVPQLDSAVIKSDRLGGNFAYSVAESHAHAIQTPIVQHVTSPVAVSYSAAAPIVSYAAPVHTYAATYGHHLAVAAPAVRVL